MLAPLLVQALSGDVKSNAAKRAAGKIGADMDTEKKTADLAQDGKADGVELDDRQLEQVAGGSTSGPCPNCGSWNLSHEGGHVTLCKDCGWNG